MHQMWKFKNKLRYIVVYQIEEQKTKTKMKYWKEKVVNKLQKKTPEKKQALFSMRICILKSNNLSS